MGKRCRLYLMVCLCCLTAPALAETDLDRTFWKHELRIGWGDQLFETLMWHNPTHVAGTMPESFESVYHENHRYTQHIWLEYQYRVNRWFGMGVMADGSSVLWDNVTRNGAGVETGRDPNRHFYNIVVMPVVRFTYLHHPNVNLYSSIGLGVGVNGGTETNVKGHHTDVGAAFDIRLLGLSANYQRWFWTVDFGGMYSLKNANTIFLASSRIVSVGFGARF